MDGVLNTHTDTYHRPRGDASQYRTVCGALNHVPPKHVCREPVESIRTRESVHRCGRCFRGEGGY